MSIDTNIQHYRAPMVTAIGIILGFVLGFMGKLATDLPSQISQHGNEIKTLPQDIWVLIGFLTGMILLTISLYRILNNRVPQEQMENYYHRTLQIFIVGVCVSFMGTLVVFIQIWFF